MECLVFAFDCQELVEELSIYFLFFDRAGYGESDPYPSRSVKSEAFDIQELADKLQIGSKFYVIGISMGAYPIWGCLKYIPHRHDNYPPTSFSHFLLSIKFLLNLYCLYSESLLLMLSMHNLQIVWSFSGSSFCALLVALCSC